MIRLTSSLVFLWFGSLLVAPLPMAMSQESPRPGEILTEPLKAILAQIPDLKVQVVQAPIEIVVEDGQRTTTQQPVDAAKLVQLFTDAFKSQDGKSPNPSGVAMVLQDPAPATQKADPHVQYYEFFNQTFRPGGNDPLESNFGLTLTGADEALRAQLEVGEGQGIVVVGVKPGSLAEQSGLKVNDLILSLGDDKVGEVEKTKKILLGLGKQALEVKLIRDGKPRRMSIVGPEHGFPAEAAEYWIGVPVSPVDATLRAHLPNLAPETGLIVNEVVKESPAEKSGVLKNDILISFGGKPVKNSDALIALIQETQGKPVSLELLRVGKPLSVHITPAKRAHPTVIKLNQPANQLHWQVVQPGAAYLTYPYAGWDLVTGEAPKDGKQVQMYNWLYTGSIKPPTDEQRVKPELINVKMVLDQDLGQPGASILRLDLQMKELSSKLDEIRKILEGLKQAEKK